MKKDFQPENAPNNHQSLLSFQMNCKPTAVLIDCSELELGRNLGQRKGRSDDHLEAYKRRLHIYRESTMPMLKSLDEENRLRIVSTLKISVQNIFGLRSGRRPPCT